MVMRHGGTCRGTYRRVHARRIVLYRRKKFVRKSRGSRVRRERNKSVRRVAVLIVDGRVIVPRRATNDSREPALAARDYGNRFERARELLAAGAGRLGRDRGETRRKTLTRLG